MIFLDQALEIRKQELKNSVVLKEREAHWVSDISYKALLDLSVQDIKNTPISNNKKNDLLALKDILITIKTSWIKNETEHLKPRPNAIGILEKDINSELNQLPSAADHIYLFLLSYAIKKLNSVFPIPSTAVTVTPEDIESIAKTIPFLDIQFKENESILACHKRLHNAIESALDNASDDDLNEALETLFEEIVNNDTNQEQLLQFLYELKIRTSFPELAIHLLPDDQLDSLSSKLDNLSNMTIWEENGETAGLELDTLLAPFCKLTPKEQELLCLPLDQIIAQDSHGFAKVYTRYKEGINAADYTELYLEKKKIRYNETKEKSKKDELAQSVFNHFGLFFLEISQSLSVFHKTGRAYVDVKHTQYLLQKEGSPIFILSDLDSGHPLNKVVPEDTRLVYTKKTVAPELIRDKTNKNAVVMASIKSDIYSIAAIILFFKGNLTDFLSHNNDDYDLFTKKLDTISERFCCEIPEERKTLTELNTAIIDLFKLNIDEQGNVKESIYASVYEDRSNWIQTHYA